MISKVINTGNQMSCLRWSCSTSSDTISYPTEANAREICLCDYSNSACTYYEMAFTAFADDSETSDEYKNDYRKFFLNLLSDSSDFAITLVDSSDNEYIIYDSNGTQDETYVDIDLIGYNDSQPFQVGCKIYWWKVADGLGYGDYTVKTSQTDFGVTTENTSHVFRVVKYNPQRANGTIKIETLNKGVTMNGTDWTGMYTDSEPYTNMIRLKGRFVLTDADIENEQIEDGNRESISVQTKLTDNYSIAIDNTTFSIGQALIHEGVMMNWKVTDYNIFNEDLRDIEVITQSTSTIDTPQYNRRSYTIESKANKSKLNRKFV